MSAEKGYIYILTNPSFSEYVKIGYADNVEKRLQQLNRSECTPFAFRVYATYEVTSRLSDLKIHAIIDKLNPNLRSIDTFNGQKRVREFWCRYNENTGKTCVVFDNKRVEYEGEVYSLSSLAAKLTNAKYPVPGPCYFKYNGEWLNTIRQKMGF